MRLTAQDLRDMNILKYYRLTRKWVCKTYGLKDADLELLIYLDCKGRFTRNDFINGVYTYSWDKARWDRLRNERLDRCMETQKQNNYNVLSV